MDVASLVFFRIAFGSVMLVAVGRYFAYGWIDALFVRPAFHFVYPGFAWVQPWPTWGMHLHCAVLGVLAAAIVVGCWTRTALVLFALGFTWVHLLDKAIYLNHYYLVSVLAGVMCLLPMGAAWSVDAWRDPARAADRVPAWVPWVLRVQLALVYFYGGVAKANADWLVHAQPLRIWLAALVDVPLLGPWLELPWMAYAFSWAGAAFDLGITPFLFWGRTRLVAYGVVVVFHVLTSMLFQIGIFPWLMIGLTPIFLDPSWPRRLVGGVLGAPGAASVGMVDAGVPVGRVAVVRGERVILAVLVAHLALQALIPLRTFVETDDVAWTEEGFRFAWRVMAMEKAGTATFRLRDPASGEGWTVDPRAELTPFQASMMATQPDMIADYARHLADEARHAGRGDVEVRADVWVSLNGRPSRRFVDPDADLARATRAPVVPRPRE